MTSAITWNPPPQPPKEEDKHETWRHALDKQTRHANKHQKCRALAKQRQDKRREEKRRRVTWEMRLLKRRVQRDSGLEAAAGESAKSTKALPCPDRHGCGTCTLASGTLNTDAHRQAHGHAHGHPHGHAWTETETETETETQRERAQRAQRLSRAPTAPTED
eukprot:3541169-Rhodomonas_salina.2